MTNFNLNPIMQTIVQSIVAAAEAHINAMIDAKITAYSQQVSEAIGTLDQKITSTVDETHIKVRVGEIIASMDVLAMMSEAHKDTIGNMIEEAIEAHCNDHEHNDESDIEGIVEDKIAHVDFSDQIESAIDNYDMSEKIGEYLEENGYKTEEDIKVMIKDEGGMDDSVIQDAVVEVLSNLTLKVNDPTISISKY